MPNSLAVRAAAASSLARVQEILGGFAARDTSGEVLTAVRHIPAREAQWAAMPDWVHPNLAAAYQRSEEHTSELQSPCNLVCRLLLEKKKNKTITYSEYAEEHYTDGVVR